MSNDKLGALGWIGFSKEDSPGEPKGEVRVFLPAEAFKLNLKPETIERKHVVGALGKLPSVSGRRTPEGRFEGHLDASHIHPLVWILGGPVSTEDLGGGIYRHTFGLGHTPASFTIEADEVADKKKQWGAILSKLELECSAGEAIVLRLEWLAKGHQDGANLVSTPAFYPCDPLTFAGASVKIGDTQVSVVESVTLSIDSNIEARHILKEKATPETVRRRDLPVIEGKLTFIDYPANEYEKLVNASTFNLELKFEEIEQNNPTGKMVKIILPACQYKPGSFETEIRTEVITAEADFEATLDLATSRVIQVVAQNSLAHFDD